MLASFFYFTSILYNTNFCFVFLKMYQLFFKNVYFNYKNEHIIHIENKHTFILYH